MTTALRGDAPLGEYILTDNIADSLRKIGSRTLRVPGPQNPVFHTFRAELVKRLERAFPEYHIHPIDSAVLARDLKRRVRSFFDERKEAALISTLPSVARAGGGFVLSVNRLFSKEGGQIGYGPRPGASALGIQIESIARALAGRPAVIVEDGVYTGGTVRFIIGELLSAGITVSAVIVGFCPERVERSLFDGELVVLKRVRNLADWVMARDLIPFSSSCGRVLGRREGRECMPVLDQHGASFAYPYILPFGKPGDWANLPYEHALELSRFCLDESVRLFECLAMINGWDAIQVRDLMGGQARVSLPLVIGEDSGAPALDENVVLYLRRMRSRLG